VVKKDKKTKRQKDKKAKGKRQKSKGKRKALLSPYPGIAILGELDPGERTRGVSS
jgi:hypothetical protein